MISRLLQASDFLARAAGMLAAIAMALLFVLMLSEIVSRNLLGTSLGFTWEVSGYLLGLVIFMASSWALRNDKHIRITLLREHLPAAAVRWLDLLATLIGAAIAVFFTAAFVGFCLQTWHNGTVSSTPQQIPLIVPRALMLLGITIFTLTLVVRAVALIAAPSLLETTPDDDGAAASGPTEGES
ncbi:TRAP transporter small permease subunit [Salinicola rhizosphaerae]|uniref:TRAP transporter small permease protein n=1 Tax=Salinicola rhizosphaerae TaxID=1443141 RepID=A0ABQ3DWV1_9GAMM|nr:TRAP transporter small permease [Salinicola rhizosphaerae]GHB18180.1 membrane protein [Salinicola rhizosphaerae]